jgi:thiamine pyrophosphate-dependent acetolactate synthase large subunit-like protein
VRLATIDLIDAVKSMATASRLKAIADARAARTSDYTKKQWEFLQQISQSAANVASSIRRERLAFELEKGLDKEAIYVTDCDSGKAMDPLMAFGGSDKTYVSTGPNILGWGVAASFGVKLARPDRPVVSILGDGSMQFGGPQPLWSMARYQAPVTVIIYNNRSYNNERNRIWAFGQGAQLKEGVDMLCYNGSPEIDFAKAASAFGVEGEVVSEPDKIAASLDRAKRANIEGRPYLLDIHVDRDGIGAASTWYPRYSIADQRTKKV